MSVAESPVRASPLPDGVRSEVFAALRRAGLETGPALPPGGSNARIFALTRDGEALVAKIVVDEPGLVDGHDVAALREKVAHTRRLRATSDALAALFLETSVVARGERWMAVAMPRCDGRPLIDLVDGPDASRAFERELTYVLDVLATHGYGISRVPAPGDVVVTDHVERVLRRRKLLAAVTPDAGRDRVEINGRMCTLPQRLLPAIAGNTRTMRRLAPAQLHFPVHGDANLRNFLLHSDACGRFRFHVLDPRGARRHRDLVYDLAKMLFSLTVLEAGLVHGFDIESSSAGALEVRPRWRQGSRAEIAAAFPSLVERTPAMARVVAETGSGWRRRLLFAHAVHLVAEAACRLSDRAERTMPMGGGASGRRNVAAGFYLLGTLLLNDVVADEDPDVAEHLALAV